MDKDKKLLSITDENTILITARFEDSKNGTKSLETLKHYDIELIVKKDITCNQLLEAIYYGLQKKIVETNPTNVIFNNICGINFLSRNPTGIILLKR